MAPVPAGACVDWGVTSRDVMAKAEVYWGRHSPKVKCTDRPSEAVSTYAEPSFNTLKTVDAVGERCVKIPPVFGLVCGYVSHPLASHRE